ncbi:hypothetical protein LJC45_04605 [Alistipes sp. OttesenSCG-928-B03]|nr:hypothetical protein [Alistipes sp. OttesenSCG-928-B03]
MQIKKLSSIVQYVLFAVSLVALVFVFLKGEAGLDFILIWTYIMLGLAIVITVLMAAVNISKNPKGARRSLMGLGVLVVVLCISYFLSSTDPVTLPDGSIYNSEFGLRLTDIGLYTTYLALVGALAVAVIGEVRKSFK